MRLKPPGPTAAPDKGLFNLGEAKRMRWLAFAFVLAVATFFWFLNKENDRRRQQAELEAERRALEAPPTVVVTPEIDGAALDGLVRDRTDADRVLIETPALARALRDSALINDSLFAPMGGRALTEARAAELASRDDALRAAARGELYRAYGWVEVLEQRAAAGNLPGHWFGRLRLEDGGRAAFAVLNGPERVLLDGDFARMDGIFLEALRIEGAAGWIDLPLFVGARVRAAYPRLPAPSALDPLDFAHVTDDSVVNGIAQPPFEAYWELVAYVRALDPATVDWASAPLLDRAGMSELALDGDAFRARPVRLPVCQVMDSYQLAQPENPLRIERLTEGWLGSESWFSAVQGLVKFVSPRLDLGLRRHDNVTARAFFLKHHAYETAEKGISVAPLLVLVDAQPWGEPDNSAWRAVLLGFGGLVVLLAGLLVVMLRRDQGKSAQLQAELNARRRARRASARGSAS
ncbi:MAG TPA: hypothetical protein VMT18_01045 [Planctomycetota bacterium]|nr:hypothetical protein [Planctomycetota bacterium]